MLVNERLNLGNVLKMMKGIPVVLVFAFLLFGCQESGKTSIVDAYGQLKVEGAHVQNECGENVQLRGMSFFWHHWDASHMYLNQEVVHWLKTDWNVHTIRVPVGIHRSGWFRDTTIIENKVREAIDAAIDEGVYVMVDWHSHDIHLNKAKGFFSRISKEYGDYPNIIYEIFNEPNGVHIDTLDESWDDIKAYSKEIIAEIRQNDPDNIIVVGTPFWCQLVDQVADDPLLIDSQGNKVSNIVYSLHFYAGRHKDELMDRAKYALKKGLPIWVTESGRTGVDYGPDNVLDSLSWNKWEAWMDQNMISWNKWSLSTRNEMSSSLELSASIHGGWSQVDLTDEGKWNRNHFRAFKSEFKSCKE